MSKIEPLVSVIVISYNQGKFIDTNLNSILSQIYPNIELIVADDASMDDSVQIFDHWLQKNNYHAKKNYHTKNTGLVTVLNECIEMANGKYIKIIAADDYMKNDYIAKCVALLELNHAHLVFTNATSIDSEDNIIKNAYFEIPNYTNIQELENNLINGNFISGSTLFTTKELYQKIGSYPKNVLLEDYNLVLKSIKQKLYIHHIKEDLIYYRRHENNITVTKLNKIDIETIKEKIKFDTKGNYASLIHFNIRNQTKDKNPYLQYIKKDYLLYKGFNFKFFILNFYSKLYKIFK